MGEAINKAKKDQFKDIVKRSCGDVYELVADRFLKTIPCYYDRNKCIFLYNEDKKKWIMGDQTDLINIGKYVLNQEGLNTGNVRSAFINAVLDKARWKEPKEVPADWIQFEDYFYKVNEKEKVKVTKDYFSQIKIPHNLGSSLDTPIIDEKIISWVGKDQYDLFVEICAYCMYKSYPFARFFIFYGTGQDGKSTAGDFITKLIGSENSCNVDIDQLSTNRFESQKLYQKTLAICGEVDYKLLKNTRKLKGVTGNDPLNIEFKNKNSFTYNNFAKLLWYANGVPPTYDKTQGFYRRTIILKFPNKFEECVNPLNDIPEEEYENFCLKCMDYLKNLLQNCFSEKSLEEKTQEYEELSNPILKFFRENIQESSEGDILLIGDLYNEYQKYAKRNGYRDFHYKEFLAMFGNIDDVQVETRKVYIQEETGKIYESKSEFEGNFDRRTKSFIKQHKFCPVCPVCPSTFRSIPHVEKRVQNSVDTLDTLDTNFKNTRILTPDVFKAMISTGEELNKEMLELYDNKQQVAEIVNSFLEKGMIIETKVGVFQQVR